MCRLSVKSGPAIVLLPTPPFPLATAITRLTLGIGLLTGGPPLVGIVGGILSPERGRPYKKKCVE